MNVSQLGTPSNPKFHHLEKRNEFKLLVPIHQIYHPIHLRVSILYFLVSDRFQILPKILIINFGVFQFICWLSKQRLLDEQFHVVVVICHWFARNLVQFPLDWIHIDNSELFKLSTSGNDCRFVVELSEFWSIIFWLFGIRRTWRHPIFFLHRRKQRDDLQLRRPVRPN